MIANQKDLFCCTRGCKGTVTHLLDRALPTCRHCYWKFRRVGQLVYPAPAFDCILTFPHKVKVLPWWRFWLCRIGCHVPDFIKLIPKPYGSEIRVYRCKECGDIWVT